MTFVAVVDLSAAGGTAEAEASLLEDSRQRQLCGTSNFPCQ